MFFMNTFGKWSILSHSMLTSCSMSNGNTFTDGCPPPMLKPGQLIRPELDCDHASRLVESLYGFHVVDIRQLDSYDDRNFHVRVLPEGHTNPHVPLVCPHGYVLKVMNAIDSQTARAGELMILTSFHTCRRILRATGWGSA